jgi:hypothetical protein
MNTKTLNPNPPADFNPDVTIPSTLQPFRFWCQKVLPLVYDDSLSYYELLCKVITYLNDMGADINTLAGDVDNINKAYLELQQYVNNYFQSLDVQEEINNKLDELVSSGRLDMMLSTFIPYITLEMFGGVGDGVTDDTLALNKAIENSYTTGRSIIITEKNFLISKTIEILKSVTIISISNKTQSETDVNYNIIFTGDGYLFNIHNGVPFNIFSNLYIKGNGKNKCFYVNSHRNNFNNLYLNNFSTCFLVTQKGDVKTFENKIDNNIFENNTNVLESTYATGSATDGFFTNNIIINGNYSLSCNVLSQWLIKGNHDYSKNGISILQGVNLNIENNYFDNTNKTSIYVLANGILNITGNQFLCAGTGNCYKIRITSQAGYDYSSASVSSNTMTKTGDITGTWWLLNSSLPFSFSGNVSFQQPNLLHPDSYSHIEVPYNSINTMNILSSTHNISACKVFNIMDKIKMLVINVTLSSDVDAYSEIVKIKGLLRVGFNQYCTCLKPLNCHLLLMNDSTVIVCDQNLKTNDNIVGYFFIIG